MKIIDLLNKIANGKEVPEKIKFEDNIYYYRPQMKDYYCKEKCKWLFCHTVNRLINICFEIIEEDKKIERLNVNTFHNNQLHLAKKLMK